MAVVILLQTLRRNVDRLSYICMHFISNVLLHYSRPFRCWSLVSCIQNFVSNFTWLFKFSVKLISKRKRFIDFLQFAMGSNHTSGLFWWIGIHDVFWRNICICNWHHDVAIHYDVPALFACIIRHSMKCSFIQSRNGTLSLQIKMMSHFYAI